MLFLELLQVALGNRKELSCQPTSEDWDAMFQEARRHCVLGVCMQALEQEGGEWAQHRGMTIEQKLVWIARVEKIADISRKLNQQCHQLTEKLEESGYWNCILKGQGMALLYPNPLWRESGDIDIWLEGSRSRIIDMTRRVTGRREEVMYHHTEFRVFDDTPVEVHFTPSWMFNPIWNRRLQRWFNQHRQLRQDCGIPVPTTEFNVTFILVHIFRHIFDEGVGMRQIIDYYYVLREAHGSVHPELSHFGLEGFARGLMWMMQEALEMPRQWMIAEPDARVGEWLLSEVMQAGNFGHEDPRIQSVNRTGRWHRLLWRTSQSIHRIGHFPRETLFELPWRVWHYLWRRYNGYL